MSKGFWLKGAAAFALAFSLTGPSWAQDGTDTAADQVDQDDDTTADEDREKITVTGSRIRRDEFSSTQPLQVIDADSAKSFGVVDTTQLIQDSIAANGAQVDATINTAFNGSNAAELPPDNGPGSASVSLRGLDAERTLVLLNGRRLSPAGAGGAPTRPDLSLIPSSLVERVEVLTGGASSIYGADAVAGVVNIITKTGFEGVEVEAFRSQPEQSGGEQSRISFSAGVSSDRGNITFGGEFYERNRIAVGDRDFTKCRRDIYDIFSHGQIVDRWEPCRSGFPDNAVQVVNDPEGDIYLYQPGRVGTNSFSLGGGPVPDWIDWYDDGLYPDQATGNVTWDIRQWLFDEPTSFLPNIPHEFGEFNDQDELKDSDLLQGVRRFSFMTQGSYDLEITDNWAPTFFFEQFYSNRQTKARGIGEQALPIVPGNIPQLRDDGLDFIRDGDGDLVLFDNPLNPFPDGDAELIIILDEDFDQVRKTEVEQIRFTGGLREEFDSLFGFGSNWSYELFGSYDRSLGGYNQRILFEPNVFFGTTLQYLNTEGEVNCGLPPGTPQGNPFTTWADSFAADPNAGLSAAGCVPIDWFADSVLVDGVFDTDAQRDYVSALRNNRTIVQQIVFGGYVTGELFDLPGGRAAGAFGLEHRIDKIESGNDVTVVRGLQATEVSQSEGNAKGETYQNDVYAEIELPLLSGQFLAEELTFNGSVRYTEEKNFGNATTYSAGGRWRPTDWLILRGDYATSFRAPNLREQFLAGSTSGTTASAGDPCYGNTAFWDDPNDPSTYNRNLDPRTDNLLAQCVASGANPELLGTDGFSISIPVLTSGNVSLDPETSDSYNIGFVLSPNVDNLPGINQVLDSLDFSATYWNIEVEDTVEELTPGRILGQCFDGQSMTLDSPFCDRLTRTQGATDVNDYLGSVTIDFINIGKIQSDGIDFNLRLGKEVNMFNRPVDLSFNAAASYQLSLAEQIDAADPTTRSQYVGTDNIPRWNGNFTWSAIVDDFNFNWRTRWIGQTQDGPRGDYVDIFGNPQSGPFAGTFFGNSSRCAFYNSSAGANPGAVGDPDLATGRGGANCRARTVEYTEDYFESDASVSYLGPDYTITVGVSNVFDADPEQVHGGIPNRSNVVTSMGYDMYGRSWFVTLQKSF